MMKPRGLCWLAVVVLIVGGCSNPRSRLPERNGPPFAEVFPDPSVLLTTEDVDRTRRRLARVRLPRDEATLEELVVLVEAAPALDTEHILLVTEAVPAPWGHVVYPGGGSATWRMEWDPEEGGDEAQFAELSDRLLELGMQRWSDPGRRELGMLLGRARRSETLLRLSDEWLPAWDDGSPEALEDILGGMQSSLQLDTFVLAVLLPQDRLQGERQWLAVDALPFDSERVEVLTALLARRDEVSMEYLMTCLPRLTFASDRLTLIEAARPRMGACSALQLRDLMATVSFDSDRSRLLELFSDVEFEDTQDVIRTVSLFSFASDRIKQLQILADQPGFAVRSDELVDLMLLGGFDSEREAILRIAAPRLSEPVAPRDLRDILRRFDFDSDRLDVLQLLAGQLPPLSPEEAERVVNVFETAERRAKARELLDAHVQDSN